MQVQSGSASNDALRTRLANAEAVLQKRSLPEDNAASLNDASDKVLASCFRVLQMCSL